MSITVYRNARAIAAADPATEDLAGAPASPAYVEAFAVQDGRFLAVGTERDVNERAAAAGEAATGGTINVDLAGATVIPGIVDSHSHLRMFGESLGYQDLSDCDSLEEIQARMRQAVLAQPGAARIIGKGWLFSAIDGGAPRTDMLDGFSPETPIYLHANDFHSAWLNSAALREVGIDRHTPDPVGGTIGRDAAGEATGMIFEGAYHEFGLRKLAEFKGQQEHIADLRAAFAAYAASGVTAAMDMSFGEADLAALDQILAEQEGGSQGELPLRVRGYWLVPPTEDHAVHAQHVQRAAELAKSRNTPWFSIVGVKFVVDGVIDACTAAMIEPFANGALPEPIWSQEFLTPAVIEADRAGLSIALHAIGDEASEIALNALEAAVESNGEIPRRHRLEHLETVTPENIQRLVRLGVVASMQPVHSDPAVQENWRKMLGDHRIERGYPLAEFQTAGAKLALSTDAPTASHLPFPNLYTAVTRKSPGHAELAANFPEMAISAERALTYATYGGAYSCGAEAEFGSIKAGMLADFTVLDRDPLTVSAEELLQTSVLMTVVGGVVSFQPVS